MNAKDIGDMIRQRRKLLKITQSDVARLASCSKPSVIAAESGKPTLRLEILLSILHVLGLSIHLNDVGAGRK
ncbi:MAG: helix-turn-helix transcriptional regulator [Fimbriimonadaceae bacterium]|nr:helix-turn-helix transcriptional regulator [Fimbriimonadaceae bacterium]